jgi:peptide/nickel transport system permease protein
MPDAALPDRAQPARPPVAPAPRSRAARGARAARRGSRTLILAALAALSVALGLLGPLLAPSDPLVHDLARRLEGPSLAHPFGTDAFGRDVLSRVLHAARPALLTALSGVALVALLGATLGVAVAAVGGRVDLLVGRLVDTLLAFPAIVLALVLAAAFGASRGVVLVAVVVALTPHALRLARARALEVLHEEHVVAARALGASEVRVVARHVLPHVVPGVVVLATGYVGHALVLEAALSYLGLGLPPPTLSWGRMLFEGAHLYLEVAPWLTVAPGLALASVALLFAALGDALRDRLDPRARHAG